MIDTNTQEIQGFGESSMQELLELRKALNVGYSDPPSGNDAVRVESLESTLKLVSFTAKHIKFWNAITKLDAYSTIEEYNQLTSYGSEGGGFVPAGVLPEEEDSTYNRANQKVKYIGTTRGVAHPTTLIRSVPADLVAQETVNGVLWMLSKIERSLFLGDSDAIPLEWNGVIKQIVDGGGTVVDARGAGLTDILIEQASDTIASNYGAASVLYANNKVFSTFSTAYYGQQRWQSPNAPAGKVGTPVKGMSTQAGDIEFESDVFLKKGGAVPASATTPKAPAAPTLAVGSPTGTDALFVTADAGSYKYQVTAVNSYGESAPSVLSSAATVLATQHVPLTITDGGGTYPATAYKIYRTDKTGGTPTVAFMFQVARTAVSGVYSATTVYNDLNTYIQGTHQAVMLDMSDQSLAFKQLSPLIKIPLAVISPSVRWMQLLYGTPIVYAPKKNVVFRNLAG